ncbi:hypothetical protein C8R45DRAFT_923819 [Mycena sanguinolenta]|nr:hypothetical protein C8R45DRAFT_923819 [Mycena sanguinolenta]
MSRARVELRATSACFFFFISFPHQQQQQMEEEEDCLCGRCGPLRFETSKHWRKGGKISVWKAANWRPGSNSNSASDTKKNWRPIRGMSRARVERATSACSYWPQTSAGTEGADPPLRDFIFAAMGEDGRVLFHLNVSAASWNQVESKCFRLPGKLEKKLERRRPCLEPESNGHRLLAPQYPNSDSRCRPSASRLYTANALKQRERMEVQNVFAASWNAPVESDKARIWI